MTTPLNKPGTIHEKILLIMSEMNAVGKNKKNQAQQYSFRGIDDIMNAVHPLMVRHGVFCVPEILEEKREERPTREGKGVNVWMLLTVKYSVFAKDGSVVIASVKGEGMDTGDKAANKAMTSAYKNLLTQIFSIHTEDMKDSEYDDPMLQAQLPGAKVLPGPGPVKQSPAQRPQIPADVRKGVQPPPAKPKDETDVSYADLVVPFGAERVPLKALSREALARKIQWAKDKEQYADFVAKATKYLAGNAGLQSMEREVAVR